MNAAIYARVSTSKGSSVQDPTLQIYGIKQWIGVWNRRNPDKQINVVKEYIERASGADKSRPILNQLLLDAKKGEWDMLLVTKIDRLARSMQHLLLVLQELDSLGVRVVFTTQGIDTDKSSPLSRLLLQLLGAVAEFERELIRERVKEGLARAKAKGSKFGRKAIKLDESKLKGILAMREQGYSIRHIAREIGIAKSSLYRLIKSETGKWK